MKNARAPEPNGRRGGALCAEMRRVIAYLDAESLLSDLSSGPRVELDTLGPFLQREYGLEHLRDVKRAHVLSFINRPRFGPTGFRRPAETTRHTSLSAVRLGFRGARQIRLIPPDFDPALDIEFPRLPARKARPLTDDEIAVARSFALPTLSETRVAAAFALAEATARPSEQALIRVSDVDLRANRVFIRGRALTRTRFGRFSPWGITQIDRRISYVVRLGVENPPLLIRKATRSQYATHTAGELILRALKRAGLFSQPGVGSNSVIAWAGAHAKANGATIDEVARMLGVRKLDTAATMIGFRWRNDESGGR